MRFGATLPAAHMVDATASDRCRQHQDNRPANPVAVLAACLALFAEVSACAAASRDPWRVVSVVEPPPKPPEEAPTAVIRFAGGFVLKPHLYDVSVIGRLRSPGGEPFLVVGGAGCSECDLDAASIFIGRPTTWPDNPAAGPIDAGKGLFFAPFPHRNLDAATKTLWDWSRLFIGRCLVGGRESVVSFEAVRDQKGTRWSRTVTWAYVAVADLSLHSAKQNDPTAPTLAVAVAVAATHGKTCREVPPMTYDEPF